MTSLLNHDWPATLLDASARSLLMAVVVAAGLHLLRVSNVRARKAAWVLVLSGAIIMPVLAPWAQSRSWIPSVAAVVPVRTWLAHVETWLTPPKQELAGSTHHVMATAVAAPTGEESQSAIADPANVPALTIDHFPAPAIAMDSQSRAAGSIDSAPRPRRPTWTETAFLIYIVIAFTLLARIAIGSLAALSLWVHARPVVDIESPYGTDLHLRWSRGVSSPVTIGSGILLPEDYTSWDAEKLRIVLAHESSHVRQGDFYLQLCAAVYAAAFWFSPLGWWLKRALCDLSEAISDGAAVSEAASHASYAQVLLEFAAMPRTTSIGVAMARTGRLSHRIELLLDENSFRRAFAGGRGRMVIAALLAPLALFAATSLVRVEAAGQTPPLPPAPPTAAPSAAPAAPTLAPVPPSPAEPESIGVAPVAPVAPAAPSAPEIAPPPPALTGDPESDLISKSQSDSASSSSHGSGNSRGQHYSYSYSDNGDSYAVVRGNDKEHIQFSGDWMEGRREQLDKARQIAHGDFLWFTHGGKSYVIDDPAIVASITAMYKPMEDLGRQQEELGRQQEEFGRQQEKMAERMTEATVPTPDIAREMANLNAAVAALDSAKGKTVSQQQLAELQGKLAEVQGKLGSLQGEMGTKQGEFGAAQGLLGARQGEFGRKQGLLGAEQGRIAREADRKVKSIIDQSLRNGKARPVE